MFKRKSTFVILILIIAFSLLVFLFSKSRIVDFFASKIKKPYPKFSFNKGEVIDYDVTLYNFKIGKAQLAYEGIVVKDKREAALISFLTDVVNFHDLEKIYANPNSFNPVRVERDLLFFGKKELINEDYMVKPKTVSITKHNSEKTNTEVITSKSSFQHVISSIYYYRQLKDFAIGKEFSLNLPLAQVILEVKRIEQIKVPAGKFEAFYIESVPKKFKIWLSTDNKRIPLRIEKAASLAPTAMVMRKYKSGSDAR